MSQQVVFFQQFPLPYFGVLSVAGYLAGKGYRSEVVVSLLEDDPVGAVAALGPDVIGISVMSVEHGWLANTVREMRRRIPGAKIVVGGIHAVLYPEEILGLPEVDIVCTCDGEEVMLAVLRECEKPVRNWDAVSGIGFRQQGGDIRINERAPLFCYGDEVIEDRSAYFRRYPVLAEDTSQRFISSRGCPYNCSFCYNDRLRTIFRDKGPYIRRKTAGSLVEEILRVKEVCSVGAVFFMDDLFTMDRKWLEGFLKEYREKIGIPFVCTTRANILDEDRAAMLADAGCRTVSYGVESGNEEIRKTILGKDISDGLIIGCGRLLKKHGLKAQTTNMFCLPGETPADAFKTIELNIRAGTDYAFASLLMPFPRTAIAEYCIEHGYINPDYSLKDLPESFMTRSIMRLPERDKEIIINAQRLSHYFIRHPWFYRNFRWLTGLRGLRLLFDYLFEWSNFLRHKGERGISFVSAFRYAWRMRKTF